MQTFLWQEEDIFSKTEFRLLLWLRYLDYIFCLTTDSIEKLKEFFEFLNAFHPSLKFTMDYSPDQINYLDVLITKDESRKTSRTSLCTKPTDTHHYLHAQSCHRSVYKKSIPYSQAVRMKRICSEEEDLQHKLEDLESWLVNRGYRAESVRREIQRVNSIDSQVLLDQRHKIQEDNFTLVLFFSPCFIHHIQYFKICSLNYRKFSTN